MEYQGLIKAFTMILTGAWMWELHFLSIHPTEPHNNLIVALEKIQDNTKIIRIYHLRTMNVKSSKSSWLSQNVRVDNKRFQL